MYYHGSKSNNVEAMKWNRKLLFLVSSLHFLTFPGVVVANDIVTVQIKRGGERDGRGGASVVYACNAGNESGPCVDTPALCTSQGGRFVGYCFYQGKYEGVCCPGLNPANATLTTKPPHQDVHDDSTTAPTLPPATLSTQTLPPAPTMTTQTMPPAPTMTSDTMPPAPTYTTQTMPPATMTSQSMPPASTFPTQTMPPAPTMTSDTLPPAPTMTTSTMSTQTMPPAPTMTTDTLPPAPTMTTSTMSTQTMPPAPTMTTSTMSTQTMPPAPTMTSDTLPPAPTMTTQTMPPAPTMSTQTIPPFPTQPSSPGLHDDSTSAPTGPSMPTMTTQTIPPAPTLTTQTMPPAPTMTTQSMPPGTMTTQTMPPAPTMTTQSMPPGTMTTQTMPPAPTMTTQSMPPGTMTTQTMPPAPTMTTQTMPPAPTETMPTAPTAPTTPTGPATPTMTTQSMPPAPTETMPTAPTAPTTPTGPATSTMTTQTMPPAPTAPQTPALPTAPAPPQTPAPPSPSSPPAHFDNSSSTHHTLFPTMSTQTFPTQSINFTTQQMNFTTQQMNFTTQQMNFTTQQMNFTTNSWNFTTESLNFTTQQMNMTMTTLPMPNITGPNFPTTTTTTTTESTTASSGDTSDPTTSSSEATTAPSFDLPQDGAGCGIVSSEIQSIFQNPSYPSLDTEPNVHEYVVMPRDGFCALRMEFLESHLAGKGMEGCSVDSVVIINTVDTPTTPQCGLLQGYEFTVRQEPGQPVKIVVTTQSSAHLWSINATQIPCSNIRPYQDYETANCGMKNPKQPPPGLTIHPNGKEEPKSIPPTKLLKSRRKTLRDIMSDPSLAPSKLLQSSVLNRETNIKIVRGNETSVNEFPWQALIMVNGKPLCGASIISEHWVVTAGHCVQLNMRYPLTSVLTVDLGDHDLRTTKETKNVVSRISKIVPNVQNEGVRNDIALLKLATKIPFGKTIRPVCLPQPKIPPDTYSGRTGITTGWGRTEDSVISPVLREATLPIISNEKCRQQWSSVAEGAGSIIESGMVCAGGGDVGPCNGDSGGPLTLIEEDRYRLVGLTSFGLLRGCAVSGVPAVFTRVSSYLDWIALNLADA